LHNKKLSHKLIQERLSKENIKLSLAKISKIINA
jgi:hypothetical protein